MIVQITVINELDVPDSANEYAAIKELETLYYEECANNPHRQTKEIKIIYTQENNS